MVVVVVQVVLFVIGAGTVGVAAGVVVGMVASSTQLHGAPSHQIKRMHR